MSVALNKKSAGCECLQRVVERALGAGYRIHFIGIHDHCKLQRPGADKFRQLRINLSRIEERNRQAHRLREARTRHRHPNAT